MEIWHHFTCASLAEARQAQLRPGDGVLIKVMVQEPVNGLYQPTEPCEKPMMAKLMEMDAAGFAARDVHSKVHSCKWDQALSWCRRVEAGQ